MLAGGFGTGGFSPEPPRGSVSPGAGRRSSPGRFPALLSSLCLPPRAGSRPEARPRGQSGRQDLASNLCFLRAPPPPPPPLGAAAAPRPRVPAAGRERERIPSVRWRPDPVCRQTASVLRRGRNAGPEPGGILSKPSYKNKRKEGEIWCRSISRGSGTLRPQDAAVSNVLPGSPAPSRAAPCCYQPKLHFVAKFLFGSSPQLPAPRPGCYQLAAAPVQGLGAVVNHLSTPLAPRRAAPGGKQLGALRSRGWRGRGTQRHPRSL